MSFNFQGIQIVDYEYHDIGMPLEPQRISMAVGRAITRQVPVGSMLIFAVQIEARYVIDAQPPTILSKLELKFYFATDELVPAIQNADLRESFLNKIRTFADSIYDTVRGILYVKWLGTPLQNSSIPIVPHGDFLRDYVFPDGFWTSP
jgi:hypothetical protein